MGSFEETVLQRYGLRYEPMITRRLMRPYFWVGFTLSVCLSVVVDKENKVIQNRPNKKGSNPSRRRGV